MILFLSNLLHFSDLILYLFFWPVHLISFFHTLFIIVFLPFFFHSTSALTFFSDLFLHNAILVRMKRRGVAGFKRVSLRTNHLNSSGESQCCGVETQCWIPRFDLLSLPLLSSYNHSIFLRRKCFIILFDRTLQHVISSKRDNFLPTSIWIPNLFKSSRSRFNHSISTSQC